MLTQLFKSETHTKNLMMKTGKMEIKKSKDYSQFSFRQDNRPINIGHVHSLIKSIEIYGLQDPIKVDLNGVILDGQHRFTALKNLGRSILYFTVVTGSNDIIEMNTVRLNWQLSDYLNYYVKKDNPTYLKFKILCNFHPEFSVPAINKALGCTSSNFKKGELKITSESLQVAEGILLGCESISIWFQAWKATSFVSALIDVQSKYKINIQQFFPKAEIYKLSKMHHCTSTAEYKQMIIKLWNWKNRNKINQ
jgi:hypothetical protein|tara:strand:+ start:149 stop:901 length:753 start_codon:yes stop_codon:yes gene_type:complete